MTSETFRVEFLPTDGIDGVDAEHPDDRVHDISLPEGVTAAPEILENPHVDFPGVWELVGEGVDGSYRYQRVSRRADTSDTVAE